MLLHYHALTEMSEFASPLAKHLNSAGSAEHGSSDQQRYQQWRPNRTENFVQLTAGNIHTAPSATPSILLRNRLASHRRSAQSAPRRTSQPSSPSPLPPTATLADELNKTDVVGRGAAQLTSKSFAQPHQPSPAVPCVTADAASWEQFAL